MQHLTLSEGQILPDEYQGILMNISKRLKALRDNIKKLGDMV